MFADEARFGRMNDPRPCWAPNGTRPQVACQLIREFVYLYGAVSPKDGTCVYLIMPASDTQCFQIFLETLAQKYPRQLILLFVDGAGNHHSGELEVPANIMLRFLPPYSPELNPQENLWDEIREKIFKNLRPQIHGRSLRKARRRRPLHRTQPSPRQIHHLIPLHRKVNLMWKWYKEQRAAAQALINAVFDRLQLVGDFARSMRRSHFKLQHHTSLV